MKQAVVLFLFIFVAAAAQAQSKDIAGKDLPIVDMPHMIRTHDPVHRMTECQSFKATRDQAMQDQEHWCEVLVTEYGDLACSTIHGCDFEKKNCAAVTPQVRTNCEVYKKNPLCHPDDPNAVNPIFVSKVETKLTAQATFLAADAEKLSACLEARGLHGAKKEEAPRAAKSFIVPGSKLPGGRSNPAGVNSVD